jgi:hypothetical protein
MAKSQRLSVRWQCSCAFLIVSVLAFPVQGSTPGLASRHSCRDLRLGPRMIAPVSPGHPVAQDDCAGCTVAATIHCNGNPGGCFSD